MGTGKATKIYVEGRLPKTPEEAFQWKEERIKNLEAMLQELIDAGHRSIQSQLEIDLTPLLKARAVLAGQKWEPTPEVLKLDGPAD